LKDGFEFENTPVEEVEPGPPPNITEPEKPTRKQVIKRIFIRAAIWLGIGTIVGFALTAILGIFKSEGADTVKILCDGSFFTGIFFTCSAFLVFSLGEGTLRPLSYGIKSFFSLFSKKPREKYYEYNERKKKNKRSLASLLPPILAGAALLLAAGVFLIIFNRM